MIFFGKIVFKTFFIDIIISNFYIKNYQFFKKESTQYLASNLLIFIKQIILLLYVISIGYRYKI